MKEIPKIAIVGTGNVAFHLTHFFIEEGIIPSVFGRNKPTLLAFEKELNVPTNQELSALTLDTLVLLCVSDQAIPEIIDRVPNGVRIAYTSGSTDLRSLPKDRVLGVFYPLQTFSKGVELDAREIPFFIESNDAEFEKELLTLARIISNIVHKASSMDRYHLHLAAVMSNNFVNHLFHLSEKYLQEHQLSFDYLKPLIRETIRKAGFISPSLIQTGPAIRNDHEIIAKHLASLSGSEKEVYAVLTRSIQNTKEKNQDEL
ncbi:MAG: DUF2520 domain-containing protein [Crocinitomicaceae bacterium]|nr:DUF2520 domain-containing protein [Crocinitomicaceae bacterium]